MSSDLEIAASSGLPNSAATDRGQQSCNKSVEKAAYSFWFAVADLCSSTRGQCSLLANCCCLSFPIYLFIVRSEAVQLQIGSLASPPRSTVRKHPQHHSLAMADRHSVNQPRSFSQTKVWVLCQGFFPLAL